MYYHDPKFLIITLYFTQPSMYHKSIFYILELSIVIIRSYVDGPNISSRIFVQALRLYTPGGQCLRNTIDSIFKYGHDQMHVTAFVANTHVTRSVRSYLQIYSYVNDTNIVILNNINIAMIL